MIERYDLLHEFPEYYDRIQALRNSNSYFARLCAKFHDVNREIHAIENGTGHISGEYLEELRKKRLLYKDKLYGIIANS